MLSMNWTEGNKTIAATNYGYYKFYFQGDVVYTTIANCRNNSTCKQFITNNVNFKADMGNGNRLTMIKNDVTYIPANLNGFRVYPGTPTGNGKWCENTEWSLFWRLETGYVNNSGNVFNTYTTGYQIGDNWEDFTAAKMNPLNIYHENHPQEVFNWVNFSITNYNDSSTYYTGMLNRTLYLNSVDDDGVIMTLTVKQYSTIN